MDMDAAVILPPDYVPSADEEYMNELQIEYFRRKLVEWKKSLLNQSQDTLEDDSLQRPTKASFQIVRLKPIDANTVEVYTKSDCNGVWFGLCKGNIVYVLSNKSGSWAVKDLYALQSI